MKIELIVPAIEENAPIPNLAFPILAALPPPDVEISFTDDLLTPIDLKKDLKEFFSFPSLWKRIHWDYSPTLINRFIYFPSQLMQHRFTKKKILEGRRRFRTGSF